MVIVVESNTPSRGEPVDGGVGGSSSGSEVFHDLFGADNDFSSLQGFDSIDDIKQHLVDGGKISFEVNGEKYTLQHNWRRPGNFQLINESGGYVDKDVHLDGDSTVDGFMEISGVKGVGDGTGKRLYLGFDDEGNFSAIAHTAELDSDDPLLNGKSHRQTLLQDGEYIFEGEGGVKEQDEGPVVALQSTTPTRFAEPAPRTSISLSEITFISNGEETAFEEMSGSEIKEFLDSPGFPYLHFKFEGDTYMMRKSPQAAGSGEDRYQVIDESGSFVDFDVEFPDDMEGDFAAISDLPGLGDDENLYVGEDKNGNFVAAVDKDDVVELSPEAVVLENDPDAVDNPAIDGSGGGGGRSRFGGEQQRETFREPPAPAPTPTRSAPPPSRGRSTPEPRDPGELQNTTFSARYEGGGAMDHLGQLGSELDSIWGAVINNADNYSGSFGAALQGMADVSQVSQTTDIIINVAGKIVSMTEKAAGKVAS